MKAVKFFCQSAQRAVWVNPDFVVLFTSNKEPSLPEVQCCIEVQSGSHTTSNLYIYVTETPVQVAQMLQGVI